MWMRVMVLAAGLVGSWTPDAKAQTPSDSAAVAEVVMDYVTGWRNGDLEVLAEVFEPDAGVLLWPSGGEGAAQLNATATPTISCSTSSIAGGES